MTPTKKLLAAVIVAAAFLNVNEPLRAGSCNYNYLTGYCTEWITAIWDGGESACGDQDAWERQLCAETTCMAQCAGMEAQVVGGCSSNQWSSWFGFRCGDDQNR